MRMNLFPKLLGIVWILSVIPVLIICLANVWNIRETGHYLGERIRETAVENANRTLLSTLETYFRIVQQENRLLEMILREYAEKVEYLLSEQPQKNFEIYSPDHFDPEGIPPGDAVVSARYRRMKADGTIEPMLISFQYPVFLISPGVNNEDVREDLQRLSGMSSFVSQTYAKYSDLVYRIGVGLENGLYCAFPGSGGFPPEFDARKREWYRRVAQSQETEWIPPTTSMLGIGTMTGLSRPIYRKTGEFAGAALVVTSGFHHLQERPMPFEWAEHVRLFLVTRCPEPDDLSRSLQILNWGRMGPTRNWQTPFQPEYLSSSDSAEFGSLVKGIDSQQSRVITMNFQGESCLWAYRAGDRDGVHLVMIVPSDKVLRWAATAQQTVSLHVAGFFSKSGVMMGTVIAASALAAWFLAGFLTRRLNRLSMDAQKIASGDWDTPIVVPKGEDEITVLARSMDSMRISLGEYVERISRNTAARVRMESEMEIAHRIQIGFLPHWDLFPDGQPVDVYPMLSPARAVGGDLYDFCLRKGNQLVFVIGDVSGKGIPASLLMADVLSRFRSLVHTIETPSAILESLNNGLCANNPSGMFITLFCAMLDMEDGKVVFSNAGHNPPVLVGQKTGFLKPHNGLVLGGFPNMKYHSEELNLAPGDGILLYTDGVTEARSKTKVLYGSDRLVKHLESQPKVSSRDTVEAVMEDIQAFSQGEEQSDDIALLMIRWNGLASFEPF